MEQTVKTWKDYLPDSVYLYYVNYQDDLENQVEVLQDCLSENTLRPIWEKIDDWFSFPEPLSDYLLKIRSKMEEDGVLSLYYDYEDEIQDWLWENDKSDPVKDLLDNTRYPTWFYSLGESFGDLWFYDRFDQKAADEDVITICDILGIALDSKQAEIIREIRESATYGGELRIYFKQDLRELISNDENDFEAIKFKGVFTVAIHNSREGAGDFADLELDLTVDFERDNLFHAESEQYDIYETYGIFKDAITDNKAEMLSTRPEKTTEIKISMNKARLESEAELNRVFANGKCTKGDMNITRHRHLEYINEYPCGHICKDCGTFWID